MRLKITNSLNKKKRHNFLMIITDPLLDEQRSQTLMAALPNVPFDGWSDTTLANAAKECEIDPALLDLLFPNGVVDAVIFHSRMADDTIVALFNDDVEFQKRPVPVKIKQAILKRLEMAQSEKEAVRKGLALLSLPRNSFQALKTVHRTADSMWRLAGDSSTDFNWYTKRMTLISVYSSTLLYWLNDDSDDLEATSDFLDRRLQGVKRFGKWKAEMQNNISKYIPKRPKLTA